MSAGKGDKLRKGANLKAYWDNYDKIFRNSEKEKKEEKPSDEKKVSDKDSTDFLKFIA